MSKLKPLLPTLREKKRYMVYSVKTENKLGKDISREIVMKIKEILGIFDSAEAGIISVEYKAREQKGILRVSNKSVEKVRSALIMINLGFKAIVQIIGVSGTLSNARSRYMG